MKGLLGLYIGKDFSIQINGETVTVEIEPDLTFNHLWLRSKKRIAVEIIANTDIKEVIYLERYNKEVLKPKTSGE